MIRLTLLLCAGMFAALLIAGEDRGQLRPGLARAAALAADEPVTQEIAEVAAEVAVVAPAAAPIDAVIQPAAFSPEADPTPTAAFTLETSAAPLLPEQVPAPQSAATAAPLSGEIRYVTASSVNVRQDPSTDAAVVGRLTRGEAALVVWQEGTDWARIVIEGDGLEGYVAARFLSDAAP